MTKPNLTHIVVVLDRSGSMALLRQETIGGFNYFIAEQKKVEGQCTLTLTQFDNQFQVDYSNKPIQEVPDLTTETYMPRGYTKLLDAIGKTINEVGEELKGIQEELRPSKVIVCIITDGQENSSQEFNWGQVKALMDTQRSKYSWDFLFLSSSEAAIESAVKGLGMGRDTTLSYAPSGMGTGVAMASMGQTVSSARRTGRTASFSAKQQEEAEKTKS